MDAPSKLEQVDITTLIPYARNAKLHSDAQVAQIAASIREFGFNNPVLIDRDNGIIAGHGRILAAQRLGLEFAPCLRLSHLTETQKKAYIIADNRLAETGGGWNTELLALDIEDLRLGGFDINLTGFDSEALDVLFDESSGDKDDDAGSGGVDDTYSRKIEAPIYEPKGEKPPIADLTDTTKAQELRAEIDAANLPDDVRGFLHAAADRHTVFHFRRIAEFYAHASPDVQRLMERSALVIIDFNQAIENGFVALTEKLGQIADFEEGAETNA